MSKKWYQAPLFLIAFGNYPCALLPIQCQVDIPYMSLLVPEKLLLADFINLLFVQGTE
jgi:hypothetical protein